MVFFGQQGADVVLRRAEKQHLVVKTHRSSLIVPQGDPFTTRYRQQMRHPSNPKKAHFFWLQRRMHPVDATNLCLWHPFY
jgi:hypothetical protein